MKLKWRKDAVSPVIATILMVAITVVLAAVLYVMVITIAGNGGALTQTPVGNWNDMSSNSGSSATIVFGSIQPDVAPIDLMVIIEDENGHIFNLTWPTAVDSSNFTLSCDSTNVTAFYFDYNPSENIVGGGDNIKLYGLEPLTFYYVKVFHYPSSSIMQMAGANTFRTLP